MTDFKKLQNGSDIRGVALEGVEGESVTLTAGTAKTLGRAFSAWLAEKTGKNPLRISIGRDSRLSGEALRDAFADGVLDMGHCITDFSLASTPAMFMSTILGGAPYDGAVMITASHLPFNRNGFKFFTKDGGLEKSDISEVLALAEQGAFTTGPGGRMDSAPFMDTYAGYLVGKIRAGAADSENFDRPLAGMKIVVDAGNGAGGFFASKVLEPLGAATDGSCFLEPDGRFPNHIPNPEDQTAMESIRRAALDSGADLGIIFDTDVDRAGAVTASGREINRNRIIALMSAIVLEEHPGSVIVTDSITSDELNQFITKGLGGVHHRFRRGYKNVINEAIRINNEGRFCGLAIETSGHGALAENYFLDDGAYLIAKILIKAARLRRAGKTIDALLAALGEPAESSEFRLKLSGDDFLAYGNNIINELKAYADTAEGFSPAAENYEGIRVSLADQACGGWFLLRMSLHDPLMPLNIESRVPGGVLEIAKRITEFLRRYPKLDLSPLESYIK